ncbi:MAG: sigma-54 dependent transcriptional regulator [Candidatus Margulisiibacteriota bacterium]
MNKILIVDDELSIRESFTLILEGKYQLVTAASGEVALKQVADQQIDLVFLDVRMPGMDGLETLRRIKALDPSVSVVMVTAVNEVQKASEAIKAGARDYLIKPFDVSTILKMTAGVLRRKALLVEGAEIQAENHGRKATLIGQSDNLQRVRQQIKELSRKELRVLVLGEPGTEKETVATLLHEGSPRADRPFFPLALPAGLSPAAAKAKFFGEGRGTTIIDLKKMGGWLDGTRGGTLFLDHVENLPENIFAGQEVEVRLIGGSSRPALAESGRELYDYFGEGVITLPPLRERLSDLPLLINHYLAKFNDRYGKEIEKLTPEVEELFSNYPWPGNLAELAATLERLVLTVQSGPITAEELPIDFLLSGSVPYGADYLALFEKAYVEKVLRDTRQDKEKAAAILQVKPALLP